MRPLRLGRLLVLPVAVALLAGCGAHGGASSQDGLPAPEPLPPPSPNGPAFATVVPTNVWLCGVVVAVEAANEALVSAVAGQAAGDDGAAAAQARTAYALVTSAMGNGKPSFDAAMTDPLISAWANAAVEELNLAVALAPDLSLAGVASVGLDESKTRSSLALSSARTLSGTVDPGGSRCSMPWKS
jgi:hypothetical protein